MGRVCGAASRQDEHMPSPDQLPDADPLPPARAAVPCRMCGHLLTDTESRKWRLGRGCRRKLQLRSAPTPRRGEVEQDTLPGM